MRKWKMEGIVLLIILGIFSSSCTNGVKSCDRKILGQCVEYSSKIPGSEVERLCRGGEFIDGSCPKGALAKCETDRNKLKYTFFYYKKIVDMGQQLGSVKKICKALKGKWTEL